ILENIDKLNKELKELQGKKEQAPEDKQRIKVIGLEIKYLEQVLAMMELGKKDFRANNVQEILEKLLPKDSEQTKISREDIDRIVERLKKVVPTYVDEFRKAFKLYQQMKGIESELKKESLQHKYQDANLGKQDKEKNPEKASTDKIDYARKIIEATLIKNLGLEIKIPEAAYNNFEVLREWLEENVFMGLLKNSDIYELLLSVLVNLYQVAELKAREKVAIQKMAPIADINNLQEKKSLSLNTFNRSSTTSLSLNFGYSVTDSDSSKQGTSTAGLGFGGKVTDVLRDIKELFSGRKEEITSEELLRLQNAMVKIIRQPLNNKEYARVLVYEAIRNLREVEKYKEEKPFAYFEAKNDYIKAQEFFFRLFGYYASQDISEEELKNVISQDFQNLRRLEESYLGREFGGTYKFAEHDFSLLSSIFFNIGLYFEDPGLNFTFVLGLSLYDKQKKLKEVIAHLGEQAVRLEIIEKKQRIANLIKELDRVYQDKNKTLPERTQALYLKLMSQEELNILNRLNIDELFKLINSGRKEEKKQEGAKKAKEVVIARDIAQVKERVEEIVQNFGKEIKLEFNYLQVDKNMSLEEMLRVIRHNRNILSVVPRESNGFQKFVQENLKDAVFASKDNNAYSVKSVARVLAENSNISLDEVNRWLDERLKYEEGKVIEMLKEDLLKLRFKYLDEGIAHLLAQEQRIKIRIMHEELRSEEKEKADLELQQISKEKEALDKELLKLKEILVAKANREISELAKKYDENSPQIQAARQ
ncbi:hypothetical protein KKC04_04830, partial [Patescibacteria group bacterium]|nr:hypothetical protein [Patescibacteria group bacterium]